MVPRTNHIRRSAKKLRKKPLFHFSLGDWMESDPPHSQFIVAPHEYWNLASSEPREVRFAFT